MEKQLAEQTRTAKRAEDVYDLANRVQGELVKTIEGEQWNYAIIKTRTNIQIWKYSPKSKHQLYTRGFLALSFEDALKVLKDALETTKAILRKELERKLRELQ